MNNIFRQISSQKRLPSKRSAGLNALFVLLCLLFLTAQVQGLSHTHAGDLGFQIDCDVCLKLSSDDDVVISFSADIHYQSAQQSAPKNTRVDLTVGLLKFYQPRAPPGTA